MKKVESFEEFKQIYYLRFKESQLLFIEENEYTVCVSFFSKPFNDLIYTVVASNYYTRKNIIKFLSDENFIEYSNEKGLYSYSKRI